MENYNQIALINNKNEKGTQYRDFKYSRKIKYIF